MRVFLLDTNIVSILFKPDHSLHRACMEIVGESQWFISFMTRGEILMWPNINRWGQVRREQLEMHIDLCTTLFPDETTCALWADIMTESRQIGRPMSGMDAWIAAAARQWKLPLVTADLSDFRYLDNLELITVSN